MVPGPATSRWALPSLWRHAAVFPIQSVREHGMDITQWLECFVNGLAFQIFEDLSFCEETARGRAFTFFSRETESPLIPSINIR